MSNGYISKQIKNVVTFGAEARVDRARSEYDATASSLEALIKTVHDERCNIQTKLEALIESKKNALNELKKLSTISENLSARDREFVESVEANDLTFSFDSMEKTLTLGETAMSAARGVGAGFATATGGWALAGAIGTASTGTSISTLSGAAATNATLAWLGGGSLASGGFGMAAGTMVLGGLAVVPALAVTGVWNHAAASKRIREIKEKENDVIQSTKDCQQALVLLGLVRDRAHELSSAIQKTKEAFNDRFDKTKKKLFPYRWSRLLRRIRKRVGLRYFRPREMEELSYIYGIAYKLTELIDQRIIDDDGRPM